MRARGPLVLALLLGLGTVAGAQVVRCRDAAGKVSYTDTGCRAGDQRVDLGLEPGTYAERGDAPAEGRLQQQLDGVERARRSQREAVDAVTRQSEASGGVAILDRRGDAQAEQRQRQRDAEQRRQREQVEAARLTPYGGSYGAPYDAAYGVPYGATQGGVPYRVPAPLPDLRPQLRDCGPAGCRDTLGNHYDRTGRLDRYVRPDGRACRPVGTTVVCN